MPEKIFKVGDVVRLKSGGPAMTVQSVKAEGRLFCQWFVEGEPHSEYFHADSLERVDVK